MQYNKEILNRLLMFSLISIPFFLITGPFLTDLSVSISGVILILFILLNKDSYIIKNYLFYSFIIWCLYLIIISLISEFPLLSLEASLFYFRFGFYSFAIYYALINLKNLLKYYKIIFLICFFILFFDSLIQYYFKFNILGWPLILETRVSSFFGEELKLGSYISRLSPILLGILLLDDRDTKYTNLFIILLILISNFLVILSGERAALLFINLFNLSLIIFIKTYRKTILSTFISLIILIFLSGLDDRILKRINVTFDEIKSSNNPLFFASAHNVIYISAFDMFLDNKILGIGPKNYREYCKKEKYNHYFQIYNGDCFSHPHNTYIQILTETGILGLIPILILFIFLLYYFLSRIKNYVIKNYSSKIIESEIMFFLALFITFFPYVPTGNFFNNWLSAIYFLPIGFILYTQNKKN